MRAIVTGCLLLIASLAFSGNGAGAAEKPYWRSDLNDGAADSVFVRLQ